MARVQLKKSPREIFKIFPASGGIFEIEVLK
jgi:hypothetical protein